MIRLAGRSRIQNKPKRSINQASHGTQYRGLLDTELQNQHKTEKEKQMIVVRENQDKTTRETGKKFCVYLRLPNGVEHEIPGITRIASAPPFDVPMGSIGAIEILLPETFVKFE